MLKNKTIRINLKQKYNTIKKYHELYHKNEKKEELVWTRMDKVDIMD